MDLGIRGRKAIVNGGSAGLGYGAALALAREGVALTISARNEARLHEACARIVKETGVEVTPVAVDHATDEGLEQVLAACPEPDILVGTCSPPPFTPDWRAIRPDDWRAGLDTGLISPIRFTDAVLPGMADRGWGRIVHIASAAVKSPHVLRLLSGAPRAALANYAIAMARAVAPNGVTINMLLPAMHHTPGIRTVYEAQAEANGTSYEIEVDRMIDAAPIPAGRFGDAEDFGTLVAMFCSAQANYVTGQSLVVGGGVSLSML